MKCQNMKVVDVLLFITNLITIYSTDIHEDQLTPLKDEVLLKKTFEDDCPNLFKIIRDNNVTNYTVDCKPLSLGSDIVNEENVLQQTCFVVRGILYFLCHNKYNVTPDLFKLEIDNKTVCPFNFSHVNILDFKFSEHESRMLKELTEREHCSKVCVDLYSVKPQCALLRKLNNYLESLLPKSPREVVKSKPEHVKLTIQKVETSSVNKNIQTEQQPAKSKIEENKGKNETGLNKKTGLVETNKIVTKTMREEKTEKIMTVMPKEEEISKGDIQTPEKETVMSDEDINPLLGYQKDDYTNNAIGDMTESMSDRSDIRKVDKISPPKDKEIYAAEGFFQAEDSHFFFYFIMVSSIIVIGYLAFHNKNKILAYALEGSSARRSRRRPNPARYRKLETNLEEAISSNAVNSASNVVY